MAILGLLSDSHGRVLRTRRAVQILRAAGATMLVHLGDLGDPAVLDELVCAGRNGTAQLETHVVFGNVDYDVNRLARYAEHMGLRVDHPFGELDIEGVTVAFAHGHSATALERAIRRGVTYVCHGHSHRRRDERLGPTRVINPGALHRAAAFTVATLDTGTDVVQFHPVTDA